MPCKSLLIANIYYISQGCFKEYNIIYLQQCLYCYSETVSSLPGNLRPINDWFTTKKVSSIHHILRLIKPFPRKISYHYNNAFSKPFNYLTYKITDIIAITRPGRSIIFMCIMKNYFLVHHEKLFLRPPWKIISCL